GAAGVLDPEPVADALGRRVAATEVGRRLEVGPQEVRLIGRVVRLLLLVGPEDALAADERVAGPGGAGQQDQREQDPPDVAAAAQAALVAVELLAGGDLDQPVAGAAADRDGLGRRE